MISMKCRGCGGELSVDLKGELVCPYCGSKTHLSDIEYEDYKAFRSNLLQYLRAASDEAADAADDSAIWSYYDTAVFRSSQGMEINIRYLFRADEDGVQMYTAKDSVIYVFPAPEKAKADRMTEGVSRLDYPSAAIRNLSRYVPTVKARYALEDGGVLLAVDKPENAYPLFALGAVRPEHAAWIVSRLENLCCVLEFSGLVQDGITLNSIFVNTRTHEAFLYGGWWNWKNKRGKTDRTDLSALRRVAGQIMGSYRDSAPSEFKTFLAELPADDAYLDFERWEQVIQKGFGGHRFTKYQKE